MDTLKMLVVMAIFTVLMIILGRLIIGPDGVLIFFILSIFVNIFIYIMSGKTALSMAHAHFMPREKDERIYEIVETLSEKLEIKPPKIYMTPDPQPNIFAAGMSKNISFIAVTKGLLEVMTYEELEGLIAHALTHIKLGDHGILSYAATAAGLITLPSQTGHFSILGSSKSESRRGNSLSALLLLLLAPIASTIIKFIVPKKWVLQADFDAATLTRNPEALASALEKIGYAVEEGIPLIKPNPSVAHMFIVTPFNTKTLVSLFSVHPRLHDRIERLRGMTV